MANALGGLARIVTPIWSKYLHRLYYVVTGMKIGYSFIGALLHATRTDRKGQQRGTMVIVIVQ